MKLSVTLTHRLPGFALDVAFTAPDGITALFGRSGSGKTTIVNAIAGLLRPDSGRITVGDGVLLDTRAGINRPAHRRRIGYVFQESRLFPHMTVRQNLTYGRWFAPREKDRTAPGYPHRAGLDSVVDLLGIAPLLSRRPANLSGGETQRVAMGRALLSDPELLLMDEPLAALDDARRAEILPYLERLRDEVRVPIVYVSHQVGEVARLATTLVALQGGRVVRAGPLAEILSDPGAVPDIGVREAGAVLTARVAVADAGDGLSELTISGGSLSLPRVAAPAGAAVRVRIRAHDVILATRRPVGLSALNVLPATVTGVRDGEGPGVVVALACGDDRLLARVTRRSATGLGLAPGLPCFAILKSVAVDRLDIGSGGLI